MSDPQLTYVGAAPRALSHDKVAAPWWRKVPWPFVLVVVVPTLVTAFYYLLIASPRYTSESQFMVRAAGQSTPSSLGAVLQNVGLSAAQSDAFAVHQYVRSRDAVRDIDTRFALRKILAPAGADAFSRYPRIGDSSSEEGLYRAFKRYVTIGYDSSTGISILRVEAFRGTDAQNLNNALLTGGEKLINRLNERAAGDAIANASLARDEAQARLASIQNQMTSFRNREQFIDPDVAAREGSQLIGGLMATVAQLRAERSQLAAEAPASPQLPVMDSRIAAYERQIVTERGKIAGNSNSIAPKISVYENLTLQSELADRQLTQATAALVNAQEDARRQKLYLDRVVGANLPDEATEPKRWEAILTVLATALLIFGVGWLIISGVREHRQD